MRKLGFILMFACSVFFAGAQTNIQFEMTVAQDGSGDFESIQAAIDATKAYPPQRITIFIKNGLYREKVCVPAWNNQLSFIGENRDKTIIIWDDYFDQINRGRNSTFFTYTFKVEADDFYAENLTISNAAGPVGQAVALHVEGNRCRFKNCKILGNQDTVFLDGENSHQLFENCIITGSTDFIFGSATVVFQKCTIISKKDSYITAASTRKNKDFGFVFIDCSLQADEGVQQVYLGRPWRPYAKTVFLNCFLGQHICSEGWAAWSNKENTCTTFYAEYNSTGPGAGHNRVEWAKQLSRKEAAKYTLKNILGEWTTQINE